MTETLVQVGLGLLGLVVVVVALLVVPRHRRPSSANAWIIFIVFVPVVGLLAFFLIGNPKLPASRRDKQRAIDSRITERTRRFDLENDAGLGPDWLRPVYQLNRNLGAMPLLAGNGAALETDYERSIRSMAADIDAARDYVHVEFYIFSADATTEPFVAALGRAVQRGVTVRVLLDHLGSWTRAGYGQTVRRLSEMGVDWRASLPVQPLRGRYQRPDLRNHRKLVVVDGDVAWLGSQNLIDSTYDRRKIGTKGRRWIDLMVRLRGPVVQEVDAVFATDWFSETDVLIDVSPPERPPTAEAAGDLACQLVPSGPGFDHENNLRLFNALLYGAQRRVGITSPYFVPDESLLHSVTSAALRGVEVELFVPAKADQFLVHHAQRSYFEQLLRAGVRVWLYPKPDVLHAKHLSVDDDIAVVGSSNLDMRSFELDLETTLLVHGASFAADLRAIEDGYRSVSRELHLDTWLQRPRAAVLADNVARLTSALQ